MILYSIGREYKRLSRLETRIRLLPLGYALYCLMKGKHMSFNLNNFVNFMDQVKDKDWVDDHVIIDGVSPEFQKQIKDKLRERLKDDNKEPKG